MKCFDCSDERRVNDAIGVCHHCSVGVCQSHGSLLSDPVTMRAQIVKSVVLPKKARILLCKTCMDALAQPHDSSLVEGAV